MARKTNEEAEAEATLLAEMKPKVRKTTLFGDNNHDAIDAQIEVLRGEVDEDEFEDRVESGDWSENTRDCAQQAADWMDGTVDDAKPSDDWKELVQQ